MGIEEKRGAMQIAGAIVIALLAGGSSPWWFERLVNKAEAADADGKAAPLEAAGLGMNKLMDPIDAVPERAVPPPPVAQRLRWRLGFENCKPGELVDQDHWTPIKQERKDSSPLIDGENGKRFVACTRAAKAVGAMKAIRQTTMLPAKEPDDPKITWSLKAFVDGAGKVAAGLTGVGPNGGDRTGRIIAFGLWDEGEESAHGGPTTYLNVGKKEVRGDALQADTWYDLRLELAAGSPRVATLSYRVAGDAEAPFTTDRILRDIPVVVTGVPGLGAAPGGAAYVIMRLESSGLAKLDDLSFTTPE